MATPYSVDPTLYLYTSLTAGSSHIITATSRLETILKANKIAFRALDVATDEKARMLWGRRSKGRKLPGLVKFGTVIGDLNEIEDWNEYGELQQQIGSVSDVGAVTPSTTPSKTAEPASTIPAPAPVDSQSSAPTSERSHISFSDPKDKQSSADNDRKSSTGTESTLTMAMRQAGAEAAAKAGLKKNFKATPTAASATLAAATESTQEDSSDLTESTTTATDPKLLDAASDPSIKSTEATAGKTPAQLSSEGAHRTSVEKIAGAESHPDPSTNTTGPPTSSSESSTQPSPVPTPIDSSTTSRPHSNQEQVLNLHRNSSIAKTKSSLSTQVNPDDIASATSSTEQVSSPTQGSATAPTLLSESSSSSNIIAPQVRTHRGSSISHADPETIAEIERRNTIPEEEPDDDVEEEAVSTKRESPGAGKQPLKTQTQDPKDGEAAGVSVED